MIIVLKPGISKKEEAAVLRHDLVRDGERWRFKRVTIDNTWAQGNPEILNALATHRALTSKPKPPK